MGICTRKTCVSRIYWQELYVAGRLEGQGAGIRMKYSETTPESLAEVVLSNLGKDVHYPRIPTDGARKAAQIIN